MEQHKEFELVRLAQSGDRDAFDELVRENAQQVYDIAFNLTGDFLRARQLTQDVFVNAYKNILKFGYKSSFFTWVNRITIELMGERKANPPLQAQSTQKQALPEDFYESFNINLDSEIEKELALLQKSKFDLKILLRGLIIFLAFVLVIALIRALTPIKK